MYSTLTMGMNMSGELGRCYSRKKRKSDQEGYYDGTEELVAVDLPGAYSMSPFYIGRKHYQRIRQNENPDVIINIVDATNLSRSLFLPHSFWNLRFSSCRTK